MIVSIASVKQRSLLSDSNRADDGDPFTVTLRQTWHGAKAAPRDICPQMPPMKRDTARIARLRAGRPKRFCLYDRACSRVRPAHIECYSRDREKRPTKCCASPCDILLTSFQVTRPFMDSSLPRHSKVLFGLVLITALYWLAMFVGTHIPIRSPPAGSPQVPDKLVHTAGFAVLAVLVCGIGTAWDFSSSILYAGTFGLIALYGVFDEATQALVAFRAPSLMDWLADVLGTTLGSAAFAIVRQLVAYRHKPAS